MSDADRGIEAVARGPLTAPIRGGRITDGAVSALAALLVLPSILVVLIYPDLRVRKDNLNAVSLAEELSSSRAG